MIAQVYVARRFLRQFALVAGGFVAVLFLIDLIEQIRRHAREGAGLARMAGLAALNITSSFYAILPLITLLAAIALFLSLSRSSELVALRAAGRSGLRILAAPAVAAMLVGALMVCVFNPVVAASARRYDEAAARLANTVPQTVSLGKGAVWLRQSVPPGAAGTGSEGGQTVLRATRASPDGATLHDAMFLVLDASQGPVRRIAAQTARLSQGTWQLSGVKEWPLTEANPEAAAMRLPGLTLPTDLTAARIRDGFGSPEAVPIWQLPRFIAGLERAGFSALRHRVWFATELARPFLMAAMVMVAAVFTMRPMRGRRVGLLVLAAFASGLALFFLRNLAQVLGEAGEAPASFAAFSPPLVAALLALAALLRLEEG
ncbi:LPS export ABC transporter permease LptG [Paracoccus contaminans]|uniref:LPS export ABC transporter permease LptG n=1 Tax=Paracoccus contaminans TaxID=1945662 RepID=A0A1W6D0M8_9RHOB|nr:LPS export ABC transporter permease LptG [Paracoccus contaminans]ARJ70646.1 LPS export ABC transporter permease LptG [Paracoccus contaminans]